MTVPLFTPVRAFLRSWSAETEVFQSLDETRRAGRKIFIEVLATVFSRSGVISTKGGQYQAG